MHDLQFLFTSAGIDLNLQKGDLALDDTLTTAILIALFTDTAETQDTNTINSMWWGNHIEQNIQPLGSKLWLLQRAAFSEQTCEQARLYALESLQWLLENELAVALDVQVTPTSTQGLLLHINIDAHQPMQIQWEPAQGYITILNPTSSNLPNLTQRTTN